MSKIAIRFGSVDFEFEGSEDFIKDGLLEFISDVSEFAKTVPGGDTLVSASESETPMLDMSVKSIAAKLGISAGPDLAKAAAAYLTLVQKQETFSQSALLTAMKSATGLYKLSTHGKNSGKIISGLVSSGVLLQTAAGTFALAQEYRDQYLKTLNG